MSHRFQLLLSGLLCFCMISNAQYQSDTISGQILDEVQVVGHVKPSASRSTVPLQVMDSKDIARIGIRSIADAVQHFSGVTVKDYGGLGGIKTVSIRSMGATHTAVSYDGVTISDAQTGQVDIGRFSLDNLSLITLEIGQNDDIFQTARMSASAGALNLKTERPELKDSRHTGSVQVKAGSFGFFNPSLKYAYKFNDAFSCSVFGNWQQTDGNYPFTWIDGDKKTTEKRINSDLQSFNTEINLYGNFKKKGNINLKAYYYDSERGLPGAVVVYNPYSAERLWDKNFFTQFHYENPLNKQFSVQAQAKYNYTYTRYIDVGDKYEHGKQENRYSQKEYYASGTLLYTPLECLSFSLAEDLFVNTLWNNFPDCPSPERWTSLTALSVQYTGKRLTVTGNLLGTLITETVKNGETSADKKRLSPSVSASYLPFDDINLRVRASYKNSFRVPSFNDLYYSRVGNPQLRPERASQYNLGLTWTGSMDGLVPIIMASIDAYYNRVYDKIVAIPTLFVWKMMNMDETEAKGLDVNLAGEIHIRKQWKMNVSAGYSYQKAIDLTQSEKTKSYKHQLPYVPEHSGSGAVTLENPWVNFSYSFIFNGIRYSLPQNIPLNRMDGYCDQSLSLHKTFNWGKNSLRIQGDIQNITDQSYEIVHWYPMPGRAYRLSVGLKF